MSKSALDFNLVNSVSQKYVRIGTQYYRKYINENGESTLAEWNASTIREDYGKVVGTAILSSIKRYVAECLVPEHINYSRDIQVNPDTPEEVLYNKYEPLNHHPVAGDWQHIEQLIRHVFGEQYELALDYIQLLYLKPKQSLPIIVLVSAENGTGKSTFCQVLQRLFGANAVELSNEILENRFNSFYVDKLLVYVEETMIDKAKNFDKLKSISTGELTAMEAKRKDAKCTPTYCKFILCSNDENRPFYIPQQDTRCWVRKVPVLPDGAGGKDFKILCYNEIPAFLHYLQHRQLSTKCEDRLWFNRHLLITEAWRKIVRGCLPLLDKSVVELLTEIMDTTGDVELRYTATDLCKMLQASGVKGCDHTSILNMMRERWQLKPETSRRYKYYMRDFSLNGGYYMLGGNGSPYVITREIISKILDI